MADMAIQDLPMITEGEIAGVDGFVLEHSGEAKRLTGATLLAWLTHEADGHGGIAYIEEGESDEYGTTYTIHYADGQTYDFVSPRGPIGETGPVNSIESITITYATNTSPTNHPSSGWQSTPPAVAQGAYLWTKVDIAFSSGTTVTMYTVTRFGLDGTGTVNSVYGVAADSNLDVKFLSVTDSTLNFGVVS